MEGNSLVTSEVHQDLLCFDLIQNEVFEETDTTETQDKTIQICCTSFIINGLSGDSQSIEIQIDHVRSTEISMVGLQVWRGALLLADYILAHPDEFKRKNVLELASGTGLTSVVTSIHAKSVIATDVDRGEILNVIRTNLEQNQKLYPDCGTQAVELDFFKSDWKFNLKNKIEDLDILLAADVVYDKEITEKFIETLTYLMRTNARLKAFIAIEQRLHVDDQGSRISPNFDYFLKLLTNLKSKGIEIREVPLDFRKHFDCYQRVEELRLWQITYVE